MNEHDDVVEISCPGCPLTRRISVTNLKRLSRAIELRHPGGRPMLNLDAIPHDLDLTAPLTATDIGRLATLAGGRQ